MMEFKEGKAVIRVPEFEKITSKSKVFYNPHMAFDRELSLAVFRASGKKEICDAFSGSGIRAILYALEGGDVTANDVNSDAVELIEENARLNGVSFNIVSEDANILLRRRKFEVVDLDPFGSPSKYLDSAMNALRNDSLLFITATDTKALCGYAKKAALRKYGIRTVETPFAKELGVRVLLAAAMREGAKYGFGFSVLLSYWRRHYIRVFMKASWSKKAAIACMNMVVPVYFCECGYFSVRVRENCPHCGKIMDCISSVFMGKIKEHEFIKKIESNDLVEKLKYELDVPFYYDTHFLAKFYGFQPPQITWLIENLKENEFLASRTIFCTTGVKTDAPIDKVLQIALSM
jgi:tRNA (guanine26-N2/guanine27-N2)-dimethyltransferase